MTRLLTVTIPAWITLAVEVPDNATKLQIDDAIEDVCPKYPEVKRGENFDPSDYTILEDEPVG